MRHPSPKSPRRRAKQARARQTITVVFEAAARVLQNEGYAGATTNRIAEVAGVSVGTIYQYFANKEHPAGGAKVFQSIGSAHGWQVTCEVLFDMHFA